MNLWNKLFFYFYCFYSDRRNEEQAFADLMDTLDIQDHRHKAAPPRTDLLKMALERIKELRELQMEQDSDIRFK